MSTTRLPVLFLTDLVVLPGMVVPIELDDAARAAVDAARSHSDGHLLVAPRLEDRYASYGVEASIVQIGRLASGEAAAVIQRRAARPDRLRRVRPRHRPLGRGRGARHRGGTTPTRCEAGRRVQGAGRRHPAAARRLAGHRHRQQGHRPVRAGRPGRLRLLAHRRPEAPAAGDPGRGRAADRRWSSGPRTTWPRPRSTTRSPTTSARAWRRASASSCSASSSTPSARSSARTSPTARRTTAPGSRRPTCPRTSARPRCARSASWSGPATRAPESGYIRTWLDTVLDLPWGARGPPTRPTSSPPARCWTPTTTAWTTSRTGSWSTWPSAPAAPSAASRSSAAAAPVP